MFNYRSEEGNEDTGEYEFATSVSHIQIGTTANIELTHAFDSDVDESNRDDAPLPLPLLLAVAEEEDEGQRKKKPPPDSPARAKRIGQ